MSRDPMSKTRHCDRAHSTSAQPLCEEECLSVTWNFLLCFVFVGKIFFCISIAGRLFQLAPPPVRMSVGACGISFLRGQFKFFPQHKMGSLNLGAHHNHSADALRGIASLNVSVAHFAAAFAPTLLHKNYPDIFPASGPEGIIHEILKSPLATILFNGHFAVLVFFVLSGYVLALPYYQKQTEKLKRRFFARYIRLNFPAAVSIMFSYALLSLGLYHNALAAELSGSQWFGQYLKTQSLDLERLLSLVVYGQIVGGDSVLNPPLWSLRIEFIGSLLLLSYYSVKPRAVDIITLPLISLAFWRFFGAESIFFISIFLGGILGSFRINKRSVLFALFLFGIYAGGFQYESAAYDWLPNVRIWDNKSFYNALGACVLCVAVTNGLFGSFFQHPLLLFFGRISFPLYLLHFLILCTLSSFIYICFSTGAFLLSINFICYLATCILSAVFMEKYVDRPSITLAHKFSAAVFARNDGFK